jgi:ankyrin repeat protein
VAIGAAESRDLFSARWERVAVSGSGLCIDEQDAAGETSLILAAERGDAEDVRVLLDAGADP